MNNKVLKVVATLGIAIIKVVIDRGVNAARKKAEDLIDRKCS